MRDSLGGPSIGDHLSVRLLRLTLLGLILGSLVHCADLPITAPDPSGPPFMSAFVDIDPWYVDTSPSTGAFGASLSQAGSLSLGGSEYRQRCPCKIILLFVQHIVAGGHYQLGLASSGGLAGYQVTDSTTTHHRAFATTAIDTGQIDIAIIDTLRHIVTGTFMFDAREDSGTTIVHVRGGRFRAAYP